MGSSHLGVFFHSKGTQTRERRVSQTAFWCRQTLGHLEEIPGLSRTNLRVSPWRPLPPCCAAARPPPPAGVALGARPAPFRRGLRPRPRLAGFARLRQAPPSLSSRSRRQSLEKWNLAAAAPCAGLAEPHWACSVAGDGAALSRKLACCSPQLIRVLSGETWEPGPEPIERRAELVSPASFIAFSPGIRGMARSAPRESGNRRAWLLVPSRLLLGFWRSPPVAQPQPQLQQLPSHLQQASAAESRSPRARAAGPALWLRARPVTPITPSLPPGAGARQGWVRTRGRRAVPGRRLRRAKCGCARATGSARPLALGPACLSGGALLPETQRPGQRLPGCREPSSVERRRGQSSCPLCNTESVLTRKWLCAEGRIREAGHRGPERPTAAPWEEWWLRRQK